MFPVFFLLHPLSNFADFFTLSSFLVLYPLTSSYIFHIGFLVYFFQLSSTLSGRLSF